MIVALPALLFALTSKSPPRHSGAPGDQTCARADCHGGTPNVGSGRIDVVFPGGPVYLPGARQTWTVVVSDPGSRLFGFQISTRLASNPQFGRAGTLQPFDANTLVLCEDGTERSGSNACPGSSVEFIEHSSTGVLRAVNAYTFLWTPPETAVGNVQVFVSAVGANGDRQATGDRTYTATFSLSPAVAAGAPVIRSTKPVLQAFDGAEHLSSGTWIQLYGRNLAHTTRSWNVGDFNGPDAPIELDKVRVNVNSKPGYVSYVSPTQVNVQVPDDPDLGTVRVELMNLGGTSNSVSVNKFKVTPALQTNQLFAAGGKNYVVAFHPDFRAYVGPPSLITGVNFRPARPGDSMILYAVGSGPAGTPPGRVPTVVGLLQLPYKIRIGGVDALTVGFQPQGFAGLYQFNVTVPDVPAGDQPN